MLNKNNYTSPNTKDVYGFFTLTNNPTTNIFLSNNWIYIYPATYSTTIQYQILQELYQKGGALWLNANGDICYRLSIDEDIHVTTCEKASRVISNFLRRDIVIGKINRTKKIKHTSQNSIKKILEDIEQNTTIYLSIHDLLLVRKEIFNLYTNTEFELINDVIYRNTLKPSFYMRSHSSGPQKRSIIAQYLYHLANYNQERFYFLLDWLASYYQHLLPNMNTHLVLIGEKKSGIDLLFNLIIKPLFGESNCISITYDLLQLNNLPYTLDNKLFYHLDNIGTQVHHDHKLTRILRSLIDERKTHPVINGATSKETYMRGQFLITAREVSIPYLNKENNNFILFKLPDDIEKIFLPENMMYSDTKSDTIEQYLSISFYHDMQNFSNILKSRIPDIDSMHNFIKTMQDDRDLLQQTLDEKLKAFHNAIISMDKIYFEKIKNIDSGLYQEIIKDFEAKRIKQPNLLPCFEYIYGKNEDLTSRTLMSALRKINHTFYSTKTMGIGAGGMKYFKCSHQRDN